MEPVTPLETLCRIILRAREYEAQVPSNFESDDDDADNVNGEDGEALSVLEDDINTSVEDELNSILDDLAEDQQAEVLAFCWVGQGTYDASDWDEALEEANEIVSDGDAVEELMEMPMMASVLDSGLAAFDISCDGIGEMT